MNIYNNFNSIYNPKETFFLDKLKYECDHADDYIRRCKEAIEKVERYKMQIAEQAQKVLELEYEMIIRVERGQDYSTKRINYWIKAYRVVKGSHFNDRHKSQVIESIKFSGKERKQALQQAQEWARKYNTKEISRNF